MNTSEIINRQIEQQISGTFSLNMHYSNCDSEYMTLGEIQDQCFISPAFGRSAKITRAEFDEIMSMAEDAGIDQVRTSDAYSNIEYDVFWNKYYNNKEKFEQSTS